MVLTSRILQVGTGCHGNHSSCGNPGGTPNIIAYTGRLLIPKRVGVGV